MGMLSRSTAPKLRYCIIGYYAILTVLGAVSAFFVRGIDEGLREFWMDGLSFGFLPHILFVMALKYPGGWLDYLVVFGISAVAVIGALKLKGWPRNLVVVGLLFAAGMYGLFAVGRYY